MVRARHVMRNRYFQKHDRWTANYNMDGVGVYEKRAYLLHIGELECLSEIVTNLHLCGWEVKILSLDKISRLDVEQRPSDIMVCVFGSILDYKKEMNALCQFGFKSPMLGVFCGTSECIEEKILDQCDEFLYWPCHQFELRQRIGRIPHLKAYSEPIIDSDALLYEFRQFKVIGRSATFLKTLSLTKKVSACDAHVLIKGAIGTGKELIAQAIHKLSRRKSEPFVALNCGVLTDYLAESVLFGGEGGTFADAKNHQTGAVEQANGGTLFLDEIDSLSLKAQVSLLRFLQELEYTPIGSKNKKTADVRVISATNKNLQGLVSTGSFRQDLMFRLNVMTIPLPSLKERVGDTELLAAHFLERFKQKYSLRHKYFHFTAMQNMKAYAWPGNIRELENRIHQELLLCEKDAIYMDLLEANSDDRRKAVLDRRISDFYNASYQDTKSLFVADFEKRYLSWLMSETNGNVTQAAQRVGKERRALGKLLKKYSIDKTQFQLVTPGIL